LAASRKRITHSYQGSAIKTVMLRIHPPSQGLIEVVSGWVYRDLLDAKIAAMLSILDDHDACNGIAVILKCLVRRICDSEYSALPTSNSQHGGLMHDNLMHDNLMHDNIRFLIGF
jgi:hypothetical protein